MKHIELKTIEGMHDEKPLKIAYLDQLKAVMSVPQDGRSADLSEVRRSIRVLDALESCDGKVLNLEDADFEFLKQRVFAARWPIISPLVIQFVEDVTGG